MPQFLPKKRRNGFGHRCLYPKAQPSFAALRYLKQKSSFWIAALSLIAFVSGNMMGQHGWYAFWKAVLGAGDDSMIAYAGITAPVQKVPNWSKLYGIQQDYTYRLVPQDALIDLPPYSALSRNDGSTLAMLAQQTYSVDFAGDYKTGKSRAGSHNGIDIRTPEGTPVLAMGNGRIVRVSDDPGGLGLYVTLKLPNVPDPKNPKAPTDLYCTTAHMSAQLVVMDQIVKKGDVIGYSGKTGYATGAHVHVQCDGASAPFIPYWPYSNAELRDAGLSFTQGINTAFHQDRIFEYSINPLAYAEAGYPAPKTVVSTGKTVAGADPSLVNPQPAVSPARKAQLAREERVARRMSQRRVVLGNSITVRPGVSPLVSILTPQPAPAPATVASSASSSVASSAPAAPVASGTDVARIEFSAPESFRGRSWETVRVTLLDAQNNRVAQPRLAQDIVVGVAYGMAEVRPQVLSSLDFKDGVAEVKVLPRGTRTVVLNILAPWNVLSNPIKYEQ